MLLKLIPAHSEPIIHYSLSFADLNSSLATPPAWTAQLAQLLIEDLEIPATMHALDRGVGLANLLEEVAFDIPVGEVRCRFVDGQVEKWDFHEGTVGFVSGHEKREDDPYGRLLESALERIVTDVRESTIEDERVMHEKEWERQRSDLSKSLSFATAPTTKASVPGVKHKKHRSFLMQIVSRVGSIINLTSPSSSNSFSPLSSHTRSGSSSTPATIGHSPPTPALMPGSSLKARALRRSARSSLVDTYRQFILSELIRRSPGHAVSVNPTDGQLVFQNKTENFLEYKKQEQVTFCFWILHSMRRRSLERMDQLLQEAEVAAKLKSEMSIAVAFAPNLRRLEPKVTVSVAAPPSLSEGDENIQIPADVSVELDVNAIPPELDTEAVSEEDTDTDGSSLHTPSSGSHIMAYPIRPPTSTSFSSDSDVSSSSSQESRDLEYQSPPVPPKDFLSVPQSFSGMGLNKSAALSPPPPPALKFLSPMSMIEYNHLQALRTRLAQLLVFSTSQSRIAAEEIQNRLEVLAVRSRRRAWSNRALSAAAKSKAGLIGAATYGLSTPFRSSSLARFMWTAEDLEQDVSSSSLSRSLSRAAFPSYRPRPRPRIGYDSDACEPPSEAGIDEDKINSSSLVVHPLVEREFEMYEEATRLSSLAGHKTGRSPLSCNRSGIGRLFPVSEEVEGEDHFPDDDDQVFLFAVRGRRKQRKERMERSFMGCDEVAVEGDEDEDDYMDMYTYGIDDELGFDDEDYFSEFSHDQDMDIGYREHDPRLNNIPIDVDIDSSGREIERPKIRPRVRSTSVMSSLLHRAKGVQNALHSVAVGRQEHRQRPPLRHIPESVDSASLTQNSRPHQKIQTLGKAVSRSTPSLSKAHEIKISRSPSPPIYTQLDPDGDVDFGSDVRVAEHGPYKPGFPNSNNEDFPVIDIKGAPSDIPLFVPTKSLTAYTGFSNSKEEEQEEFTLAMDLPRGGRRETGAHYNYLALHRPKQDYLQGSRRPSVKTIFGDTIVPSS